MTLATAGYVLPIALAALAAAFALVAAFAFAGAASGHPPTPPPPPPARCTSRFLGEQCTRTGPHDLHTYHDRVYWDTGSDDATTSRRFSR